MPAVGKQIGDGKYTNPVNGGLKMSSVDDMYCVSPCQDVELVISLLVTYLPNQSKMLMLMRLLQVVRAERDAVERTSKAWIPQTYKGKTLWNYNSAIESYIANDIGSKWDLARTLRLLITQGTPDYSLQLLIPPELVTANGFKIDAKCVDNPADLGTYVVDYDKISQDNIQGQRTDPFPPS